MTTPINMEAPVFYLNTKYPRYQLESFSNMAIGKIGLASDVFWWILHYNLANMQKPGTRFSRKNMMIHLFMVFVTLKSNVVIYRYLRL